MQFATNKINNQDFFPVAHITRFKLLLFIHTNLYTHRDFSLALNLHPHVPVFL